MFRNRVALALAAVVTAAGAGTACAPRTARVDYLDAPIDEHVEVRSLGAPRWLVEDARVTGATLLTVRRFTPCEVVLVRTVDRTEVHARTAPRVTAPLFFAGAGALGVGLGVLGIVLSRPSSGNDAAALGTGVTVTSAGSIAFGVATGLSLAARDRRVHLGRTDVRSPTVSRCVTEPSAPLSVALHDGAGKPVRVDTTDAAGTLRLADADVLPGAALSVEGEPATDLDLSGLRCSEADRAALDAMAGDATAALRARGWRATAHLGHSDATRAMDLPGDVHAFAIARGEIHLDAAGTSSALALPLIEKAGARSLAVASRARVGNAPRPWPLHVGAPGCWLLVVAQPD